jgi:hypothetical protein
MSPSAALIQKRAITAVKITSEAMREQGYNAYHAAPLAAEVMRQLQAAGVTE